MGKEEVSRSPRSLSRRATSKTPPAPIARRSNSSGRKRGPMSPDRRRSRSPRIRYSRDRNNYRSRSRSRSRRHRRPYDRYSHSRSRSYSPYERRSYDRRRSYSRSPLSQKRRHVGTQEHPQQSRCLGVFGLSVHTTEDKINQIFSKFGDIERVQVVIDAKTGRSRGFCFVYYDNLEDAKVAKEHCSGMEIDGRRIRVDYSITARAHTPTPGVYMGRPTRLYKEREYHDRYREEEYNKDKYRYRERHSPSPRERRRRYERSRSRSYSSRDRRYR